MISADTYQSAPVLQELTTAGFKTQVLSVDRTNSDKICEPYYYLKSALYDQRIKVYKKCDLLTEELVNLERTSTGKIDHPPKGSKDQADAVCGSLYMASKFTQEYAYSYGESLNAALDVNMLNSGDVTKQQMIDSFRQELAGIYSEIQDNDYRRSKAERDEYQDYQDILNGIIAL